MIYESPDGGQTIYQRPINSLERQLIQKPDPIPLIIHKLEKIISELKQIEKYSWKIKINYDIIKYKL